MITITSFPRIVKTSSAGFKVGHIPGDHRQIMFQRGGGDQRIRIRWSGCRNQPSPSIRDPKRNGKNVGGKHFELLPEPFLERDGLGQIPKTTVLNSTADFSNRNDTQSTLHGIVSQRPSEYTSICAVFLAQFGDEIGIQQIAHQKPFRVLFPDFRSRSNSKSGAILPNSKKASKRVRGFSATSMEATGMSLSAVLKIRRCSSSAETPCSAARCFSLFASASGMFLTNN